MKKCCRLLIVLLVCCVLVGCGSKNELKVLTLSGELKKEVETAWREIKGRDLSLTDDIYGGSGYIYYGTYQGAVVIFEPNVNEISMVMKLESAGETFAWGKAFKFMFTRMERFVPLRMPTNMGW